MAKLSRAAPFVLELPAALVEVILQDRVPL